MRSSISLRQVQLLSRPELLRACCIALAFWGPILGLILALAGLASLAVPCLEASAVVALIWWAQGHTKSTRVTGNLVALTLHVFVTLISFHTTGLLSAWFVSIPIIAAGLVGPRTGLAWAAAISIQTAVFYRFDAIDLGRPVAFPARTMELLKAIELLSVLFLVLTLVILYELFRKQAEAVIQARTQALKHALDELKWLQEILPICMHCRRVRDKADSWLRLEKYLDTHSGLRFSHGLCEECLREHYPESAMEDNAEPGGR